MGEASALDARFRRRLPRILLAAAVMGVVLWGMVLLVGPWLATPQIRYVALAALVLAGIAAYFAAAQAFGALRVAELRGALRR
jgi:putative peptidoglycan lipid II flippase